MAAGKKSGGKTPQGASWTRHDVFLRALGACGNVTAAASGAGLDRRALYRKRNADAAFRAAWEEALALGVAALEDEARRRACEGWEEPVWYRGTPCGSVKKYSDKLLILLLKGHMPDKYRDNAKREHVGAPTSETVIYRIPDNERD
jgi:hypothetical protein